MYNWTATSTILKTHLPCLAARGHPAMYKELYITLTTPGVETISCPYKFFLPHMKKNSVFLTKLNFIYHPFQLTTWKLKLMMDHSPSLGTSTHKCSIGHFTWQQFFVLGVLEIQRKLLVFWWCENTNARVDKNRRVLMRILTYVVWLTHCKIHGRGGGA